MVKYWTLKCLYSCPDTFSVWLDTIGNFSPERTNQVAEYLFSTSHSEEIGVGFIPWNTYLKLTVSGNRLCFEPAISGSLP